MDSVREGEGGKIWDGALPQRRVVWMWFGAFPGAFGLGRAQPQRRVKWLTGTDEVVDQALNDQQSRMTEQLNTAHSAIIAEGSTNNTQCTHRLQGEVHTYMKQSEACLPPPIPQP